MTIDSIQPIYIAFLFLSGIILINISVNSFRKRKKQDVLLFALLLLSFACHTFGYAMELMAKTEEQMLFWINIEYLGISFYPFLITYFSSVFTDERRFASRFVLALLFSISCMTLLLVFTNEQHHLFYQSTGVDLSMGFPKLKIERGPWYQVNMVALYGSIIYSTIVFGVNARTKNAKYRIRALFMLVGASMPAIFSLIYYLKLTPSYLDVTPIGFFFTAMFMSVGLSNHDILNLVPLSYKTVFDNIEEAVITIDSEEALLNYNNAAKEHFHELILYKQGQSLQNFFEKIALNLSESESNLDKPQIVEHLSQIYEVKMKAITTGGNRMTGRILVFRDITLERQAIAKLKYFAVTDGLTGLYNRRRFMELAETLKNMHPTEVYSIAMLDIDHFKNINDQYGHLIGDDVLTELGKILLGSDNPNWICGRYGGEEFVILSHSQNREVIHRQFEKLHQQIQAETFTKENIRVTVSIGVTFRIDSESLTEMIGRADELLYYAKSTGRNRIAYERRSSHESNH